MHFDKCMRPCKYYPNRYINLFVLLFASTPPAPTSLEKTRWIAFGLETLYRRKGINGNYMEGTVCKGKDLWEIKIKTKWGGKSGFGFATFRAPNPYVCFLGINASQKSMGQEQAIKRCAGEGEFNLFLRYRFTYIFGIKYHFLKRKRLLFSLYSNLICIS